MLVAVSQLLLWVSFHLLHVVSCSGIQVKGAALPWSIPFPWNEAEDQERIQAVVYNPIKAAPGSLLLPLTFHRPQQVTDKPDKELVPCLQGGPLAKSVAHGKERGYSLSEGKNQIVRDNKRINHIILKRCPVQCPQIRRQGQSWYLFALNSHVSTLEIYSSNCWLNISTIKSCS